MKVIFLDIDGVLNSSRSCMALGGFPFPGKSKDRDWHKFDDVAVGLLRSIVSKTGAEVVLSSSWRIGMGKKEMKELGERLGVNIFDKTRSSIGSEKRGHQIQEWLDSHTYVTSYVIIDDSADMLSSQKRNFVRVNLDNGLSYEGYKKALDILSK